jgi:hypothetical protein
MSHVVTFSGEDVTYSGDEVTYGEHEAGRPEGQWTRPGQIGVGVSRYAPFLAKSGAQPQPEFHGFALPRPQPVVGRGFGIIPAPVGIAHGVHGVVGRGRGIIPRLQGHAVAEHASSRSRMTKTSRG